MRVIIQRVSEARVSVNESVVGEIKHGYMILLGIATNDTEEDLMWTIKKITALRVFNDNEGKMNLNIQQVQGEILVISQFTLYASTKKGNRPSFIRAASPDKAREMYDQFCLELSNNKMKVEKGVFGADMKVKLINDGPVTIYIDSKNRE